MNIREEIKDIDDLIVGIKHEMRNLKFYSAVLKKNSRSRDDDFRKDTLKKVSVIFDGLSNTLSNKSMDINVQLENKSYSIRD